MLGFALILAAGAFLLLVLITKAYSFETKLRRLEERLGMLERGQQGTEASRWQVVTSPPRVTIAQATPPPGLPSEPSSGPPPAATAGPGPSTPAPATRAMTTTTPEAAAPDFEPTPLTDQRPIFTPPQPEPVPVSTSRTREEWEALIGGKLLNRIGALALIIGVGFFLKHAIDNEWINEVTRVLMGAAVGLACLFGADRARTKGYQIFSQGLVGAGLAILYLSVYASFNFYQLVPLPIAFGLMGVVTVIAFLEAFRNDSLAVSILACMGGLLTPVMLSTPEPNEVGLFAYLLALNLGVVLILFRKSSWVALEPLALAGTYALYFSWHTSYYTTEHTLAALMFLALFWALHHGPDLFRVVTAQPLLEDFHRLIAWFHAALSFGALYVICIPHGDSRTAVAATIAALLYIASAFFVARRRSDAHGAVIQYGLAGSTFLAWAVPLEFEGFTIVYLWTVEAFALVWLGTSYRRRFLWIAGLVLFSLTGLTLLTCDGSLYTMSFEGYLPVLNLRALAYVLLAAAVCASAYLIRRATPEEPALPANALHSGWILLLFIMLTVETNDVFRSWMVNAGDQDTMTLGFARYMAIAMVWSLYGLILVWLTRRIEISPVVFAGVAVTFAAACLVGIRGIAFESLAAFTPVFNTRVCALLCVAAVMFLETRWLGVTTVHSTWIPEFREAMLILGVALLLVLLTGETRDVFEKAMLSISGTPVEGGVGGFTRAAKLEEASRLENLKQLSLSGVWLLFSIAVMAYGIWRRTRALRLLAMALFGVTILKIFIYDLSFLDTLYRIFSFIGLGLILLGVSYLYQRYRAMIVGPTESESTQQST